MAYSGTTAPIPLGTAGLLTDAPQATIPPNAAIKANNVSLWQGKLNKSPGSSKYSATALEASVVGVHDWWPTASSQRLIAVTANGKIWRDTGDGTWGTATAITTGLGTLNSDVHMVSGGAEAAGNSKRLFIFTGGVNQLKMLTADGTSTANITTPAADWSANYPTFGLVYNQRLLAFGNANAPHNMYISKLNDHTNFASGGATSADSVVQPIFTGEGDGLIAAIAYKGIVLLFKRPYGVYIFDWSDQSSLDNIQVSRYSDTFGIASPHALSVALDDLLGGSNSNSIFSLKATNALGSLEAGDVLKQTQTRDYYRNQLSGAGTSRMHSLYYPEKQVCYFTGASTAGSLQDRMIVLDMSGQQVKPSLETKDQPNCLALRKDSNKIPRPIYGSTNGFVYQMDQNTRAVGTTAYLGEFQTPYIDFSYLDGSLADKAKLFDFLQITFVATGAWRFFVDVYIDGKFIETLSYLQVASGAVLDSFVLDVDRLSSEPSPQQVRKPMHGSGKTVSFRVYNGVLNEYFQVERIVVGFRVAAEQNKSS